MQNQKLPVFYRILAGVALVCLPAFFILGDRVSDAVSATLLGVGGVSFLITLVRGIIWMEAQEVEPGAVDVWGMNKRWFIKTLPLTIIILIFALLSCEGW